MSYPIENKLVVAVSTTALFDFSKEHEIYRIDGVNAFRKYQVQNRSILPLPGAAFPFIRRLLHINNIFPEISPVEVVLLSRNHPDAGQRVMDALPHYNLNITRAIFLSGSAPYPYMEAVNAVLYLSTDKDEVREAVLKGHPAGHVLPCVVDDDGDLDNSPLRIAFDFDGVIVDDEAEGIFADQGLPIFHHYERTNRNRPLNSGPLLPLLKRLSDLQKLEMERLDNANLKEKKIRVAIITARNAPAHDRLMTTMENYGIEVDELLLTGGIDKKRFLDVNKPHIFFDDQIRNLEDASKDTPCVHIPFGIRNR